MRLETIPAITGSMLFPYSIAYTFNAKLALLNSLSQLADALNKEPSLNATPAVAYLMKDSITNIQNQIPNLVSQKVKLA